MERLLGKTSYLKTSSCAPGYWDDGKLNIFGITGIITGIFHTFYT